MIQILKHNNWFKYFKLSPTLRGAIFIGLIINVGVRKVEYKFKNPLEWNYLIKQNNVKKLIDIYLLNNTNL
mgnify:CR=1 FL=1